MTAATASLRRWPYLTATGIGIVIWFAMSAVLRAIATGAYPGIWLIGFESAWSPAPC